MVQYCTCLVQVRAPYSKHCRSPARSGSLPVLYCTVPFHKSATITESTYYVIHNTSESIAIWGEGGDEKDCASLCLDVLIRVLIRVVRVAWYGRRGRPLVARQFNNLANKSEGINFPDEEGRSMMGGWSIVNELFSFFFLFADRSIGALSSRC